MSRVIFQRANVIDGANPAQPDMSVVVNGNHIEEVVRGTVEGGPGDRVIDLAGQALMPGMYVCHLHAEYRFFDLTRLDDLYLGAERPSGVLMAVALQTCRTLLESGFTGFAGGACSFDIDAQLKMCIAEGVIQGPRILAASRHINTTGHDNDRAKWWYGMENHPTDVFGDGPDELRKAVRREIRRGAQIIKIFPTAGHGLGQDRSVRGLSRDELRAIIDTAHERGAKVRAHCAWRESIIESVEAGVDVIDHADEIDEACVELMAERGTYWTPSMMFLKALLDLPAGQAPEEQIAPVRKDYSNVARMVPIANEAGVNIVLGDDYGSPFMPHIPGIYAKEMSIYVNECGVKPLDVLRWATRNGARLCGLEGMAGTIAPGALADVVVVDGDPTSDISLLEDPDTNISAVMVDGVFSKDRLPA